VASYLVSSAGTSGPTFPAVYRADKITCSSEYCARRVQKHLGLVNTTTIMQTAFTLAPHATLLCIRAPLNLTRGVGGLPSSTVSIVFKMSIGDVLIVSRSQAIPGAVTRHEDRSMGLTRIEITCTACGGHLGHVFKGEGFSTPSRSFCGDDVVDGELTYDSS
jgi:hypothetical protein